VSLVVFSNREYFQIVGVVVLWVSVFVVYFGFLIAVFVLAKRKRHKTMNRHIFTIDFYNQIAVGFFVWLQNFSRVAA
jgi:hypothetical protein